LALPTYPMVLVPLSIAKETKTRLLIIISVMFNILDNFS
jgi:hypothetical protein